ncbi:hypothetical protein A6B42_03770 [Mannheimia varigena]|nr:hypothetical protein A6B42_03770 [Mannheimia varigena]
MRKGHFMARLPKRTSYSLNQTVEYINKQLKENITILDLFHYIKHHNLRTVFRMSGTIFSESAYLNSVCENEVLNGKRLYNVGIQYHNEEYSLKEDGGLLKAIEQQFKNEYLELNIRNSLINKEEKRPLFNIRSFDEEIVNFTGFNHITFDGYFELPDFFYKGTDEELAQRNYLEINPDWMYVSAFPEPLKKTTNIHFTIHSEELLKIPYSGIEILHSDLETFIHDEPEEVGQNVKSSKSETSYLNIIQALKDELLADGKFKNQSELITFLSDKYQGYTGLTESNLRDKFAKANQIK